jgi:hypothetical protein
MQTIISRALADLGIAPLPSRRCFSLMSAPALGLGGCCAKRRALAPVRRCMLPARPLLAPPSARTLPAAAR